MKDQTKDVSWPSNYEVNLEDVVCPKCSSKQVGFFFTASELFENDFKVISISKRNVDSVDFDNADWVCEKCNHRWFSRAFVKRLRVRSFGLKRERGLPKKRKLMRKRKLMSYEHELVVE